MSDPAVGPGDPDLESGAGGGRGEHRHFGN
jgi:hypothetical protein